MQQTLTLRGLPATLARDGWWLATETHPLGTAQPPLSPGSARSATGPGPRRAGMLLALVLLADLLFWRHAPGLSLAVFAAAIFAVAWIVSTPRRNTALPALVLIVSALPVLDYVQPVSVFLLLLGLVVSLAWLHLPPGQGATPLLSAAGRLARSLPLRGMQDLVGALRQVNSFRAPLATGDGWPLIRNLMRNWAFPIGGALILMSLLVVANPVIDRSIYNLLNWQIDAAGLLRRALFWIGLALILWPVLQPLPAAPKKVSKTGRTWHFGLNAGSVLRSLWVFNAMLAVQTMMDASILLGGANLPEGVSYATYAHRGAYPLLITALLAGGFALAARPFLREHRALKPLLVLWLVQNVALCASAALRLEIYIDAYGLTFLRIRALIWIALVAAGLLLTAWQILRARSNGWLLARAAMLGIGTLYFASFVNFSAIIADNILSRMEKGLRSDFSYLCDLDDTAAGVIIDHDVKNWDGRRLYCPIAAPQIKDWRDWGFRKARLARYVFTTEETGAPQ
ncbi:DUF4173 domain-containing protein [Mesobacterium sp. TK19101]|uniref:DUF4173 domain-containing protein n=1 Tax=Mesobacterium hydrothermale TaxID=3111907 RepID=A0ABU6HHP4_9RHOB|nr:DUF4173 domain-containing protein [Mesobacterium sp. TK19101]MEC3861309.1 DUF4173 domain-containing protein [Mesobacterium sp. TK19101]